MPLTEVRIYFGLGSGGFPSMDLISALDSPDTNIPTSRCTSTLKSKPEPRMFFPKNPYSSALARASRYCSELRRVVTGIDKSLMCAYGICADYQAFQHLCGLPGERALSMNAPGSPSWPLTITYLSAAGHSGWSPISDRQGIRRRPCLSGWLSLLLRGPFGVILNSAFASAE